MPSLIESLEQIDGVRFAVIDAAHFEDLQGDLSAADLPFMPLYLDERDGGTQAAGPHLVPLKDRSAAQRIAGIAGDKPAVVWWVWPDEGDQTQANLERHLRGINMAEIPLNRYDAEPDHADDGGMAAAMEAAAAAHDHDHDGHHHDHPVFVPPVRYELVIFRHADPNVMAMLLPLLDAEQVSRLFGRASGLVLDTPEQGAPRPYPRPHQLPDMPNGWLRISPEQYEGLGNNLQHQSRLKISRFLRDVADLQTRDFDDKAMYQIVMQAEKTGGELGVSTERGLGLWAFLIVLTGGAILSSPELRNRIASSEASPDTAMEQIVDEIAEADDEDMEAFA